MSKTAFTYQLSAELLRSLEAAGFSFGVGQHLQLQQLLSQLPTDIQPQDLALMIAPLLCKNDKEQEQFYEVFVESLARVQAVNAAPTPIIRPKDPFQKWREWFLGVFVVLSIIVAAGIAFLVWENAEKLFFESNKDLGIIGFRVSPDSSIIKNIRIEKLEELKELAPIVNIGMGTDSAQIQVETAYGRYQVLDSLKIQFTADTLQGLDSLQVFLYNNEGYCAKVLLHPTIEKTAPEIAVEKADSIKTDTYTPRFQPIEKYPYPNDIYSLEVEQLTGTAAFIAKNIGWLKPLFLLLCAALLWVIIQYRDSKRQKLIAELKTKDQAPYIWNIKIPDIEQIALPEAYYSVLNKLRQRTSDEHSRLDVAATVKATIANAGMVDFRYRQMTRPPEYLLLIDQESGSNHRAQVFDYLYQQFRAEEIIIDRFFYQGDPRLCFNEDHPDGITIKELQHRFYNARLILLSNGYTLLSPLSGKLAKWTNVFSPWKERALLTPRPTDAWGRSEEDLERLFQVLPASLEALNFLVSEWDAGEDARFSEWKNKVKDSHPEAIQLEGGLLPTLQQHYSEEMLQWIAACAVYPALHWDLTLYLGQLVSKSGQSLLSVERLLQLNRLPWFVQGEMPPEVRTVLLAWLEDEQPALLRHIRTSLHQVLQQNQPPKNSVAWEEYSMNQALNEWLICQDSKRKKALEKEIAQKLEVGIEADFTVVKYLDRKRTALDFVVPNSWKKHLHHGGHTGLGMKDFWKEVGYALVFLLVLGGLVWAYEADEVCDGEVVMDLPFLEAGKALCVSSVEDRILLNEWLAREALKQGAFEVVDSLIENSGQSQATRQYTSEDKITGIETEMSNFPNVRKNLALAALYRNLATDFYNAAVPLGNRADSLLQVQDLTFQTWRDSACLFYFNKALELDSLNEDIQKAQRWCAHPEIIYPVASFSINVQDCCAPCTVEISNQSKDASFYEWDFGNGQRSRDSIPLVPTYNEPGTYTILLIASNVQISDTIQQIIEICNSENKGGDNAQQDESKLPESLPSTSTTDIFTDSRDGQSYPTVTIGQQTWMAKNLNYETNESWCYLEMPQFCDKLGRLYTWEAAKTACPEGWHLPSDEEWKTLLDNYGVEGTVAYQALIEGGENGFSVLLGGYRDFEGKFSDLTNDGLFWSNTESDADNAWFCYFDRNNGEVNCINDFNKRNAFSCRCLKD